MSPNLVDHARREIELVGEFDSDPRYAAALLAAIAAFDSYDGHSGGSLFAALDQMRTLMLWGALSPLTDDPREWVDHNGLPAPDGMWQSCRCSSAFSTDHGKTFYLLDGPYQATVPVGKPVGEHQGRKLYATVPGDYPPDAKPL